MPDPKAIAQQAKKIMDEFMAALGKLDERAVQVGFEREESVRESDPSKPSPEFKQRMLRNAPKKKDDFLLAEKKHW